MAMTTSDPQPTMRAGMGAVPFDGGVAFRVWAPHASSVEVLGSWNDQAYPLAAEVDGYWSGEITQARLGDEYRYAIVNESSQERRIRSDPYSYSLGLGDDNNNSVIVDHAFQWQTQDFQMPAWHELVIYEIHMKSYLNDCHHARDGHPQLDEMCDHISRLADLGINAIEIMPTKEFSTESSWGYNPQHIFAVEREYGGPDALKRVIDTAHHHGIAVLLDVVYNHFGPEGLEHSYWQFDGWSHNGLGGIYFYNDWRANSPVGSQTRPDYSREPVRNLICDNVQYWLKEFRIDGMRFDLTSYIRNVHGYDYLPPDDPTNLDGKGWTLLQRINDEVDQQQPWKLMVAEDMRENHAVNRETNSGGLGFDSQWDVNFHHILRHAMVTPDDANRDMHAVAHAIGKKFEGDALHRVIYTENHDEVGDVFGRPESDQRVIHEISPSDPHGWWAQKRSTLGVAAVLTSPGIPLIFQGQEMLEERQFTGNKGMDWTKLDRFPGIVELYRDLIRLRRNWWDNTRGLRGQHVNVYHVNNWDKLLAFHRWDQGGVGDDVVVILNFANRGYDSYTIGMPRGGKWSTRFNSDWNGYSPLFENHPSNDLDAYAANRDGLQFQVDISIGKYSALVLSQ